MKARYKAVVDRYAQAIRSGQLSAGSRLPTHRTLAAEERLSLATATRVYRELEEMGLVSGETGRGTFVRDLSLPPGHGVDQQVVAADVVDLNFNYPSLPAQGDALREALRQLAMAGDIDSHLRYQPHAGRLAEREIIARHLTCRHFAPDAENVLIVNGAQHGLAVTVMGLLRPGDVVAVDALTYSGFKVLAALYHLELAAIPCRADGPDLQALHTLCQQRRVRAVYTMPTLHNPLGWVLNAGQRQALADLARQHDLLIIEDAAYARLVSRPPPPVVSYAPERTVYVTGFSKNIATGLRVGVVISPPRYRPEIERAIRATTWNTPTLISSLICAWIEDGTVARFETQKRQDARQRQQVAREVLCGLPVVSHPDSYFVWLPLGEESRADRLANALMERRISVSTAEPFCVSATIPQALRIALGSVPFDSLRPALLNVRDAVEYEQSR
ncbi:aminotransferase-like domain-containing protein [Klebsiella quasipneumoniae]|jgi:DNA-binding transcriptional MocR family regulator|uniref:aminotransferase-like domain-containing protein n=1 Tax=Klebsiella quasipneumoniae TaxID=1463165 RepID=UPI000A2E5BE4|nr:PLP-dependent aminotransferase family protein [Klebsiella quasipneumoniae]MVX95857.1 aminotransferase class I/II-fold pyridoxal phosphate-dependent enzyme [Enterobacteriaceae bacterium 8376wB9]MVY11030.1 aminotransferase class I/II-fold pyridoxal phosphate-dependent enzyme [Enterobacteriaceae bacterium 8376wH8]MBF7750153.1 PLP-dependent aminotransferase family protein [Klebsiella quasipneumoniae]MBF7777019.1 PLP-dependent aminotransferase family protein [Klebsiella quasipneumoniae]OSZ18833.